MNQRDWQA
jgi:molecular chaperone GrpE (heat shock protein)